MGLFDPSWKKAVARSPSWFVDAVEAWDPEVTRWLQEAGVPRNGYDLCKSLLYGRMGECLQALTAAWTTQGASFLAVQTKSAATLVPKQFRGALINIMKGLWGDALLRAAFRDRQMKMEPREGRSRDAAVLLQGAADNTLAVAAVLWAVTDGELAFRDLELSEHGGRPLLVVDYTAEPLLGAHEDQTLFFTVHDGPTPSVDVLQYQRLAALPVAAFA